MNFLLLLYALCSASVSSVLSEPLAIQDNEPNITSSSSLMMGFSGGGGGGGGHTRRKRSVFHLVQMMTCAVPCNPLDYKGYGCYCGFLGSGIVVDGIDKCCKGHDWCYENARCKGLDHYFTPYKWKCNGGSPYCVTRKGPIGAPNSCGHQLCECDREFVECLKQYPCPKRRAVCMTSPWRYWQNLFMGMSSGTGTGESQHAEEQQQPAVFEISFADDDATAAVTLEISTDSIQHEVSTDYPMHPVAESSTHQYYEAA